LEGPIPSALGGLKQLVELHLGGNLLTEEIPKELGELVLLEKLSVELGGTLYSKVLMM